MAKILYIRGLESVVGDGAPDCAARAGELEVKTVHQLRTVRDQCLSLITLRAQVARGQ